MRNEKSKILIYGANGYSGRLISAAAARASLPAIVAGRNRKAIEQLAAELELAGRVFDLSDRARLVDELKSVHTVIHCAGPFVATARTMIEACLESNTHYTDITGEWEVFLIAAEYDEAARQAGVVVCPGAGFDVIPTDCLAWALIEKMPDACEISIAVDAALVLSPGSTKTLIESFTKDDGISQRDGKLQRGVFPPKVRNVEFTTGKKTIVSMSLGDVAAVARSSGVDTVDVYHAMSPKALQSMQKLNRLKPLLRTRTAQAALKWYAGRSIKGPDNEQRNALPAHLWGEAVDSSGRRLRARISTPNGYTVTADGAVAVAAILQDYQGSGYCTPAMLGGKELLCHLPGVSELEFVE